MASTLPTELVEEILIRIAPDDPTILVSAGLVCKAWQSILSDHGGFLRRYRRFHGAPPLLGYVYNNMSDLRFVPTTSVAHLPPIYIRTPALDYSSGGGWVRSAMDCRHGRVLIQATDYKGGGILNELTVWDPITGDQQHLSVPAYPRLPQMYKGSVLCAKDGCDHLDCHGGPFLVVLVGTRFYHVQRHTWARVYSSETGAWSALTPNDISDPHMLDTKPSILFRDVLYFSTFYWRYNIMKYDLRKHELSVMDMPGGEGGGRPILIKGDDEGLGVAAVLHNCIYLWSLKVGGKGVEGWVKYKVVELDDTLLPKGDQEPLLVWMAEGTNTVFMVIQHEGTFMLDLKSKQARKIGERETCYQMPFIPYTSFCTPKFSLACP